MSIDIQNISSYEIKKAKINLAHKEEEYFLNFNGKIDLMGENKYCPGDILEFVWYGVGVLNQNTEVQVKNDEIILDKVQEIVTTSDINNYFSLSKVEDYIFASNFYKVSKNRISISNNDVNTITKPVENTGGDYNQHYYNYHNDSSGEPFIAKVVSERPIFMESDSTIPIITKKITIYPSILVKNYSYTDYEFIEFPLNIEKESNLFYLEKIEDEFKLKFYSSKNYFDLFISFIKNSSNPIEVKINNESFLIDVKDIYYNGLFLKDKLKSKNVNEIIIKGLTTIKDLKVVFYNQRIDNFNELILKDAFGIENNKKCEDLNICLEKITDEEIKALESEKISKKENNYE